MLTSLSLLGNGSLDTFPLKRMHATMKELLQESFPVRSVSYQRKIGDWFLPALHAVILQDI
jgi:hypothetical protein